jgi:hypothetical protein
MSDSVTTANVVVSKRQILAMEDRIHDSGSPRWNNMFARPARRSFICARYADFQLAALFGVTYNYGVSH